MRILIVSQYFTPEVGATQTRMHQFAKHLSSMGHSVRVVCEFPNHPEGVIPEEYEGQWVEKTRLDGFDVTRLWVRASPEKNFFSRLLFYFSFMFFPIFKMIFNGEKYDVVLATSPPLFVGAAGWVISFFKRAHFILDVRDLWPAAAIALGEISNPVVVKTAELMEGFLYRMASLIVVVTEGFRDYISKRGVGKDKMIWIPNGTVEEIFQPEEPDGELRKELGIEPDDFVVTFAGNHGIAQGLDSVVEAAEMLRGEKIKFLFVGEGPVKSKLVRMVEKRDLSNVIFHSRVPLEEITRYLAISDATLVPLRDDDLFEMFIPSKMFDFLACGKPVLLSVRGEAREILKSSEGGMFVEPENPEDLKKKIEYFIEHPERTEEMGERGRNYVLDNFTRKKQAKQLEKNLREL